MIENYKAKEVKNSGFNYIYSQDNREYLYHGLLTNLIEISKNQRNILFSLDKKAETLESLASKYGNNEIETLLNNGFLVSAEANEIDKYRQIFKNSSEVEIGLMYLLVTDACNARCKYCFIENPLPKEHHFSMMSEETAKKGIDFYFKHLSKNPHLSKSVFFYGGEPLMNKKVVEKAIEYINETKENQEIKMSIVTNGTLIDKEIARKFKEGNVSVSVSIDGPESVMNSVRPLANGDPDTFSKVVRGWNILKEEGISPSISLTLSRYNVPSLKENVQYLTEILSPSAFGFNFLIGTNQDLKEVGFDREFTSNQVIDTFQYLREKGIFEDKMMRRINAFVKKTPHLKDCGAIGNQIVVSPEGYIGTCHAFAGSKKGYRKIEEMENVVLEEDEIFKSWARRQPLNLEECFGCRAIGICGGGCPYQGYLENKNINVLDKNNCEHNKRVLDWIVKETIKENYA